MKKITLLLVLLPALSFGWGAEGHRIIGAIADMHLNQIARSKLNQIMGQESIAEISNWLDWKRDDWHGASPFHYISMPVDALRYEPSHCANEGICAVSMIDRYKSRLMDEHESPEGKTEAIKVIVHLFEDLHMPLHTGGQEGDYGGNAVKVDFFGKKSNLHKVYDFEVIQYAKKPEEEWIAELTKDLTPEKISKIQEGSLLDWVNESHQYVSSIYDQLPKEKKGTVMMNEDYVNYADKLIQEQMLEAGLRLAKYLNNIMGKVVIK